MRLRCLILALLLGACGRGVPVADPVNLQLPALHGGAIDVASYRGKVVVLHAFTTWSLNAQLDLPALIRVSRENPEEVQVIGIALDPDGYDLVEPWRRENDIPYLLALGTDAVRAGGSRLGRITEVPTTIVLDRRGREVARVERPLAAGELPRLIRSADQR